MKKDEKYTETGKQLEKVLKKTNWTNGSQLDDYISNICLSRTVGEVLRMRESSNNARASWAATLVTDAIFNLDIGSINQIVQRVDGSIPTSDSRNDYANIMGDALDDVLDYENAYQRRIFPEDTVIIALAKAVLAISVMDAGNNFSKKKEKQQAIEMILQRTGGRKTEPTRLLAVTNFVQPDWMVGLPEGGNNATQGEDSL